MLTDEKIEQLINGIEWHLNSLRSFTQELKTVQDDLKRLKQAKDKEYEWAIKELRSELALLRKDLEKRGLPESSKYEANFQEIRELLESDEWPEAVNVSLICDGDIEKEKQRAETVLDMIIAEGLKGKRFLDCGCKNEHVVEAALKREAKTSIGYDIKPQTESKLVTSNFNEVCQNGLYDIILVHDVIDHLEQISPLEALLQIRKLCSKSARVYVRVHPWSSRHGGHLYTTLNKSYAHLVFDEIELTRLGGHQCDPNIKITTPTTTYKKWFEESGFEIKDEAITRKEVNQFFLIPNLVHQRLLSIWPDSATMKTNMEIEFIEYVLEPDQSKQQMF